MLRTLVLATVIAVSACGILPAVSPTVSVKAERNPSIDLAAYRTWAWTGNRAKPRPWNPDDPASRLDALIRNGVARELAARGVQPATTTQPDLLFDYDIMVREKSTDTLSGYFDYRARGGGGDMGDAFMGYEEGTLVIVAYDPRTRQMVWRGSATAMLTKERIKDAVVDDAIHRMFQRFA
jgi:hypothetical protein